MTKDERIDNLKNKISIINAERKRQEECDDVHLRKIKDLEKENAELKEAIKYFNPCCEWDDDVHDCEFRHYAMEYGSELTKAKELIEELASSLSVVGECDEEECELINKAQKFINKPII